MFFLSIQSGRKWTPYDTLMSSVKAKEREKGWTAMYLCGPEPPENMTDSPLVRMMEKFWTEINEKFLTERIPGFNPNDYDDDEVKNAPYYLTLSEAEVAKMKFVYIPEWVFDRIDTIRNVELFGQTGGFFTGSGRDSDRMIRIINDLLRKVEKTLVLKKVEKAAQGFFELFAITNAAIGLNWWYISPNCCDDEDALVNIANTLSILWRRALDPEICTAAGVDPEDRATIIYYLDYVNENEWNPKELAKMNVIYTEEQAAKMQIVHNAS